MEKLAQLDVNTGLGPMSKCEVQPFNSKVSVEIPHRNEHLPLMYNLEFCLGGDAVNSEAPFLFIALKLVVPSSGVEDYEVIVFLWSQFISKHFLNNSCLCEAC